MKKRYKRGAVIVESAIIYPIIILTSGVLISITVSLYSMTESKVNCDAALREAAGEITGTTFYLEQEKSDLIERVYKVKPYFGLYQELAITSEGEYGWNLLMTKKISKDETSRFTLHDECRFIRNSDLISEGVAFGIDYLFGGDDNVD